MAYFTYTAFPMAVTISAWGVSSGQRVRFFVRRNPGTAAVIDQTYTAQGTSLTQTFSGLSPQTSYAVNVGTVVGNSTSWFGAQYFTTPNTSGGGNVDPPTPPTPPTQQRPFNWSWWNPIYQGAQIRISANEWNAFCARINEFRSYKGLGNYWFTAINSGTPIAAWIVNQARTAIADMAPWQTPYEVRTGDSITASFFIGLQNALNSIA